MKIEFNLLGNAVDSIERAIELLAWRDEPDHARRLKQAVLSIAHGIELLLKERLRRVHPVLVWENVDKFPSLSARTVTVDTALSRLEKIGGLTFSDVDSALIRSLRDTRNAIEHYTWFTTKEEAEQIVGDALGFGLHFAKDELGYDFFGYHTRKDDTFRCLLDENPQFARSFQARYEQRSILAGKFNALCNYCHAMAVNLTSGVCELCGHWNNVANEGEFEDDIPF